MMSQKSTDNKKKRKNISVEKLNKTKKCSVNSRGKKEEKKINK